MSLPLCARALALRPEMPAAALSQPLIGHAARRRTAAPATRRSRPLRLCAAALDKALTTKLEAAKRTLVELTAQMSDPDLINNSSEYQKVAKNASDMEKARRAQGTEALPRALLLLSQPLARPPRCLH